MTDEPRHSVPQPLHAPKHHRPYKGARHAGVDKTLINTDESNEDLDLSMPMTLDAMDPDAVYGAPEVEIEEIGEVEDRALRKDEQRLLHGKTAKEDAAGQIEVSTKPAVGSTEAVGRSAALISICVIISRITGFGRTWAMAFALGSTFLASTYQVANNLPNMLYELVLGGMLVTAFLPVYMEVKKKLGEGPSNAYASNLLTIVVVVLGIVSLLCILFPAQVIYTQSFYSNQEEMGLAIFFFQFFAIQTVFYGASAIVSGLLNANREYFWPSIAPVFNNIIVIVTFLMFAFIAPKNQEAALYIIAIGNPLGVFVQMAIQIPALKKQGIYVRPRIDFHDPSLKDTLRIGAPALFVTVCEFVTVSVTNASAYAFADNGPSVIAYARLWFTFPYSFLAVPVTTAMFTELADMEAEGNTRGVVRGIISGSSQIFFLMIPMAFYLMVFAQVLVTLYHVGAFTEEAVNQIAVYLTVMAAALPFYGVNTYLQKVYSSIRRMGIFSLINLGAVILQVIITAGSAWARLQGVDFPMEAIAVGTIAAYLVGDVFEFIYLRHHFGRLGISTIVLAFLRAVGLGGLGALVGAGVLYLLQMVFGPFTGSLLISLVYVVIAGLCSLAVTFLPAIKMDLKEASFVTGLYRRLMARLKRN